MVAPVRLRVFVRGAVACAGIGVLLATAATAGARGQRHQTAHVLATRATIPLRTALFDPYSFVGASNAFDMAKAAGASYVRLPFSWSSVAPEKDGPDFVANDPTAYSWSGLDQTVTAVEAAGLQPMLDIVSPPKWAFAVKPSGRKAGTPSVSQLGQFAQALAKHFNGVDGPPVRVYQVWNEPNNSLDLSPVKPATYRSMVNAVANSVHKVSSKNLVIAGGLDPFENLASDFVSQAPLAYMRAVLCLSKGAHPHRTCKAKIHFDIWSHHPYTFGGPFGKAKRPDDVSLGDLSKMTTLLRAARRLHTVVSSHPIQFWVTEFSWDTSPPRRHAAPLALQARWTAESLHQMWLSGVSLVTWFLLQDRPKPSVYQSGLYFHSKSLDKAKAKPTRTAFRFPFVAYLGNGTVSVWGRDATSTKKLVTIQRRTGIRGHWRTVARIEPNRYGIFKATLKLKASSKDWLRAQASGSGNSLAFSLTVPKDSRYGPWGN